MAKTIQQIQAMITDGYDQRQIINEIADYIQANPDGSPEGSSYLSYVALFGQAGTSNPVVTALEDSIGGVTWARGFAGYYQGDTIIPAADINKVWWPGVIGTKLMTPINTGVAIGGYLSLGISTAGGVVVLVMDVYNSALNDEVDFSTLLGSEKLSLPELRYYNQ